MTVRRRAAIEADVDPALDLFVGTLRDMLARNGVDPGELHRDEWRYGYPHVFRSGIFRVAEEDGELVAICHAIVRGPLWFLSGFWTRPDRQRSGIGGRLLRGLWDEGRAHGASTFFTWSSVDTTAIGPAAWRDSADANAVLGRAVADAHAQSAIVRLRALRANHDTIRFALANGLRLAGHSHLLTTRPFGHLERYVPSGPTLF